MPDFATVSMDSDLSADVMVGIVEDIRKLPDVEGVRALEPRAIDPASLMILVEVAGNALTVAGAAWTLIDRIRTGLRERKITGATITLPNGTRIEFDNVTEDQIAKIMSAAR
jgi:hypothetical protein